jgi:hypothetical protein
MAEQLSIFGIVVGVALLLAGIGFIILALVALGGVLGVKTAATGTRAASPVAGH